MKRKVLTCLIYSGAFCAITVGILLFRGILSAESEEAAIRILSDGFFVSGVLSFALGSFVLISREGVFCAFSYTFHRIWVSLHKKEYRESHRQTYAEYRARKSKGDRSFIYMLVTAAVFIGLAVLFAVVSRTM